MGEAGDLDLGRQRHPDWHTGPEMKPYLRVANVFEDRIDTTDLKEMDFSGCFERYKLHPGDVLLNEGQSPELLGRPAIYRGQPENIAFTNTLIRFRPHPSVTSEWALLVFRHHMHSGRFARESRITTNIAHLSSARLKSVEFPIPPLGEQRRSVAIVDEHLSGLVSAEASIESARRRAKLLWLSGLVRVRERADREGTVQALGALAATALGKMLDAQRQVGDMTPYLRNINVRWGSFDLDDVQSTVMTEQDRLRLDLRQGDLLVCEGGEPGRCAVWPREGSGLAFQKAIHRVRVNDQSSLLPGYVALIVEEGIRVGRWERLFTGTTIKHLPQQQLRKLDIPVPSLGLQERVLADMASLRSSVDGLDAQVKDLGRGSISFRRALLAAAFSGRLTGHSSDSDVIEELAEQETA